MEKGCLWCKEKNPRAKRRTKITEVRKGKVSQVKCHTKFAKCHEVRILFWRATPVIN